MLTPNIVKKCGKIKTWDSRTTQLILEMLAHRTPPSCVAPNILLAAEILLPNVNIIQELPSIRFVRSCRSVLLHVTKTLASYQIGKANSYEQLFSDGTSRRQTSIQNVIIRFLLDGGFKTITLSTSIIAEDETSESLSKSIMQTFKESGALLDAWRDVTVKMYPAWVDLLEMIPKGSNLTLSKLAKQGMITTDTCAMARKFQWLPITEITALAEKEGWSPVEINFFEGDCW